MMDFYTACLQGKLDQVKECIQKRGHDLDWDEGLIGACKGARSEIVRKVIGRDLDGRLRMVQYSVSDRDHLEIAALMLERGATYLRAVRRLSANQQNEVYAIFKEKVCLTCVIVLDNKLPDHLIRTIAMEYLQLH